MNDSNFKLINYMAKRIKKLNETTSYYKTLDFLSYILGFKDYNDLLHSNLTTFKLRVKFIWWKLGIKIKEFKKLVDLTKYIENYQLRSTFNLKDIRLCDKL